MRNPEDYEKEIEALKAEIERIRGGAALMTVAGAKPVSSASGDSFTIQGLTEMILVVDQSGEIGYLNDRMAQLLGIPADKRKEALRDRQQKHVETLVNNVRKEIENRLLFLFIYKATRQIDMTAAGLVPGRRLPLAFVNYCWP